MKRLLLLLALLGPIAHAMEPIMTPTDIDTCSNSTTDTSLQISRVQTCARAAVTGYGLQSGFSFAHAQSQVLKVAATACGDAVAGSIGELCNGGDPMATIVNLASTCGTAMAAIYARALTGSVVFDMSPGAAEGSVTSQGKLQACGSTCSNAQGAAQAFAQAAACGVAKATDNCIAATTHVKTRAFTHAFVKETAEAWGRACTTGVGMVTSGGDILAGTASASIARAMGLVAAQACANCPTCNCKPLPNSFNLNDAGDFSNAAADIAAGRIGLARAMAQATTTFCSSDGTVEHAKSKARALIGSWSDMVIGALGSVRGFAISSAANGTSSSSSGDDGSSSSSGSNSGDATWACGGGSLSTELSAMRNVSGQVLGDAAALVYGSWCPQAAAKFANLETLMEDSLQNITKRVAERCSQTDGNGVTRTGLSKFAAGGLKPLVKKAAEALTAAKSCGCQKISCTWCKPGQAVSTPQELAAQVAGNTGSRPMLVYRFPSRKGEPSH